MHELTFAQSIADLVADRARHEHIARVSRVVVEIGVAAPIDLDSLRFCFPIMANGTGAAGAQLIINSIALRAMCEACQTEYAPENLAAPCPVCGGFARTILAGREMRVVSFDGE
jgi:hydrogenase nickel incorporation protein HypA/HybF